MPKNKKDDEQRPKYNVSWTIDIDAENSLEAAKEAKKCLRDEEDYVFFVTNNETGAVEEIDLSNND